MYCTPTHCLFVIYTSAGAAGSRGVPPPRAVLDGLPRGTCPLPPGMIDRTWRHHVGGT
jgi:hypothetical protein